MKQLLLVFLGGGAGSIFRFLLARMFNNAAVIPIGTLTVNIFGSLLIGLFVGLGIKNELLSEELKLLLIPGFCGGFTTFSAFTLENQMFLKNGDFVSLGFYILFSLLFGIGAIFLGIYLARLL